MTKIQRMHRKSQEEVLKSLRLRAYFARIPKIILDFCHLPRKRSLYSIVQDTEFLHAFSGNFVLLTPLAI